MSTPHWLHTGSASHRGRRPVNEDAVLVDGALLAVADGVGGAPRGDLASAEAVEALVDAVRPPSDEIDLPAVSRALVQAVQIADEAVHALAARWTELRGTATTMVAAIVHVDPNGRPRAVVANVGDSRCYLIRNGVAHQVTTDQTLANQLAEAGVDDAGGRADHIVTNILGGPERSPADIESIRLDLYLHDVLLLCSDGVSGVLEPVELATIVERFRAHPNHAAAGLVHAAWDAGSTDNLTATVAYIGPPPPAP